MIAFLGPPASGKSTQLHLFKNEGFKGFSVGEFARSQIQMRTEFGVCIQDKIEQGCLISLEEVFNHIDIELFLDEKLILDGVPRSVQQAKFLNERNVVLNCIVEFCVPFSEIQARVCSRLVCQKCHEIFSGSVTQCSTCNSCVQSRKDDANEVFLSRFNFYMQSLDSIFNYYQDKVRWMKVDAIGTCEEVFGKIKSIIVA